MKARNAADFLCHGIVQGAGIVLFSTLVSMNGLITAGGIYYPLPQIDVTNPANAVELRTDSTNVVVTTYIDYTAFSGIVILEYTK